MPEIPSLFSSDTQDEETREETPTVFVLYHAASHVTGNRLGDYLGVPHGREYNLDHRPDYLIRWGNRGSTPYRPSEEVFNSRTNLNHTSDKLESLDILESAGINVPEYTTDRDALGDDIDYPALGRDESHTRGEDIRLILQQRDDYFGESADYFVEYIPTEREYRMHVVNGEVIETHEKRLLSNEDPQPPYLRNHETGWIFAEPREREPPNRLAKDAVGALGLDFGAVDIIRGEDGEFYVLEVNSAPSLEESNLQAYGDTFAEETGIEPAGLSAVEWDDEDESDDN